MSEPQRMPCAVRIQGSLGDGVLIRGTAYRVAEVREHWEPSPEIGGKPTITTVIRFDPVEAAVLERARIRANIEGLGGLMAVGNVRFSELHVPISAVRAALEAEAPE